MDTASGSCIGDQAGYLIPFGDNMNTQTIPKTNLVAASRQWASRPADQRFWTLAELHERTKQYAQESKVKTLALSACHVADTEDGDLRLVGPQGGAAQFQHYSFGQMSGLCAAPASYLRGLPAPLAASNLNHGLSRMKGEQILMFHQNGGLHLRCVTSDQYERIWNYEIAETALALEADGWRTPPARSPQLGPGECQDLSRGLIPTRVATEADVLRVSAHPQLGIKVGDTIAPSGLYASDHDCFIFQINEERPIEVDREVMYRGVFWSNSEVGSAKIRATLFLYDSVCGNHIVWGAKVVADVAFRHTGQVRRMFQQATYDIQARSDKPALEDINRIKAAKGHLLGASGEGVIETVFRKQVGLSRRECEEAYVIAERHEGDHGKNPRSAWGFAAGVTRLSQGQVYADTRDRMDRSAGKVLQMSF